MELQRVGASFTWTDKQLDQTWCVLDRVFVSPEWESQFLACSLEAVMRLGYEHCPLIFDSDETRRQRSSRFFFEVQWREHLSFPRLRCIRNGLLLAIILLIGWVLCRMQWTDDNIVLGGCDITLEGEGLT